MKAFLILEDGTVFEGAGIGADREIISEIVFNTSMTGYLEVLTDPSYAGQAVVMTYPLIGNYGITPDMESERPWVKGYIVRELSRMPSNFRCEGTIQDFLIKHEIPGIAGIDTRALTKILREKGTMNGMITTREDFSLEEILPKLKEYTPKAVVEQVTCKERYTLKGKGKKWRCWIWAQRETLPNRCKTEDAALPCIRLVRRQRKFWRKTRRNYAQQRSGRPEGMRQGH